MFLKNKFIYTFKLVFVLILMNSCQEKHFELQEGAILFQDLDKDSIDSAIEKVTKTNLKYNFTHVAIAVKHNNELQILEAISTGVQITSIDTFLNRNLKNGKPKVVVGKLNSEFRVMIKDAIKHGKSLIGLPYDDAYTIGDNSMYCSELLYEMFHHVNPNTTTFQLKPMTFKDPKTNKTLDFWVNYYKELHKTIPEGKLGLNPNGMSTSPNITLVYDYLTEKVLN